MSFLIYDAVILILLLLAVAQGYRRGFVLTLCGFLAVFVAFIGATFLSDALAGPVSQAIRPVIQQSITHAMEQSLEEQGWSLPEDNIQTDGSQADGSQAGGENTGEEPDPLDQFSLDQVLSLLQDSALVQAFTGAIRDAVGQGVLDVTAGAARAVSDYIARQVARMALFLVSFVVVLVCWLLLSRVLDLACRLPVLSTLNHWSGAALGLIKGGALLFIACWLLRGLLPQEAVRDSVLLRFFVTYDPISCFAWIF